MDAYIFFSFQIYIPNNELNHIQLVVIMLLTITVCMMFVFLGFLIVRRRLSSQLPFQPRTNDKSIKCKDFVTVFVCIYQ